MNMKITPWSLTGFVAMTVAIAAASVLAGCSHGISKGQLADAINEKIGKEKTCLALEDKNSPTWPTRVKRSFSSVEQTQQAAGGDPPMRPILADMQAAGYLHITQEKDGEEPWITDDVITPTEEAKGWWNVPDGFCVGTKAVADVQEWTLPGKDSGAPIQLTEVTYTWHLVDVPSWAQRPEFKNIEGMANPAKATAELQMTNNGWKAAR
ncbi:MAG: hypothetical protein WBQ86_10250 [Candidatus Binatus sp.]